MLIKVKYKKWHERDSKPRSSVYETDTLPPRHIYGIVYPFRYRTFNENINHGNEIHGS